MSGPISSSSDDGRRTRVQRSALWAAWGDALGFVTERADRGRIRYRAGVDRVEQTVAWRRKIGGQAGPTAELAAGCLSDDTQLRLATSRSIQGDGSFDVEAFAKVELTIWPTYALGAGRGSQAAAAALRRRDASWDTNFFQTKQARYVDGGGNGASMRIQPHVWSAPPSRKSGSWIADVIANAVCTHGHARGIVGATFHAACVERALVDGEPPGVDLWPALVDQAARTADVATSDARLSELWLGQWEARHDVGFAVAVGEVIRELEADLAKCRSISDDSPAGAYAAAVEELGAFRPEQVGSAIKTSVLALFASTLWPASPRDAIATCANALGTDTDTIATMAGAILGPGSSGEPESPVADYDYILREADRMWAIGASHRVPNFPYPDLLRWEPPRNGLDAVLADDDQLHLAGLGPAGLTAEVRAASGKSAQTWEWLELWFGQSVLAKRRPRPASLRDSQRVRPSSTYVTGSLLDLVVEAPPAPRARQHAVQRDRAGQAAVQRRDTVPEQPRAGRDAPPLDRLSLHELTDLVIASSFDASVLGAAFLVVAERNIEDVIAFAAIIAKARASRRDKERRHVGAPTAERAHTNVDPGSGRRAVSQPYDAARKVEATLRPFEGIGSYDNQTLLTRDEWNELKDLMQMFGLGATDLPPEHVGRLNEFRGKMGLPPYVPSS